MNFVDIFGTKDDDSKAKSETGKAIRSWLMDSAAKGGRWGLKKSLQVGWGKVHQKLEGARQRAGERVLQKESLLDAFFVAALGHEHLIYFGPPGAAKTMSVFVSVEEIKRHDAAADGGGAVAQKVRDVFWLLLNRTTLPDELIGPIKITLLMRKGILRRNHQRSVASSRFCVLDEILEGDALILNLVLSVIHERVFWDGFRDVPCKLISMFGATTRETIGRELAAFYDRFLLRCKTGYYAVRTAGGEELPPLKALPQIPADDYRLGNRLREMIPYYIFNELESTLPRLSRSDGRTPEWCSRVASQLTLTKGCETQELEPLDEFRFLHYCLWSPAFLESLLGPLEKWHEADTESSTSAGSFFARFCRLVSYLQAHLNDRLSDRRVCKIFKILLAACLFRGFRPWDSGSVRNQKAIGEAFKTVVPHLWEDPKDAPLQKALTLVAEELARSASSL